MKVSKDNEICLGAAIQGMRTLGSKYDQNCLAFTYKKKECRIHASMVAELLADKVVTIEKKSKYWHVTRVAPLKKEEESKTLGFTDYVVRGVADVTMWGGGNGFIHMTPFHVTKADKRTLLKNLNDAGFGVESINGGFCDIYKNFEGYEQYVKTVQVGKVSDLTIKYYNEAYEYKAYLE